jgi:hypothetical protein
VGGHLSPPRTPNNPLSGFLGRAVARLMALKPTGQPGRPLDYEMNGGDKPNERRASLLVKNLSATSRQGGRAGGRAGGRG